MKIKYVTRQLFVLAIFAIVFNSCNDAENSKTAAEDSADKKFNPATEHKNGNTYNPTQTDTDSTYKHMDSTSK